MTLTEELRQEAHCERGKRSGKLYQEALDEIERLRAELAWVRDRMSGFCGGSWETAIAARIGRALETEPTD